MNSPQILARRRLGLDERVPFQKPQRLAELDGHPEPYRVERMIAAKPVLLERHVVDKSSPVAHAGPCSGSTGGQRIRYSAALRLSTTCFGSMVATLRTATRSPASSSFSEEARMLTMSTPSSRTIWVTSAMEPERLGRATSRRLPGLCAPTSRTSALITSEVVRIP